jgi:hypothetical protein
MNGMNDSNIDRRLSIVLTIAMLAAVVSGALVRGGILDSPGTWFPGLARAFSWEIGLMVGLVTFFVAWIWMAVRNK